MKSSKKLLVLYVVLALTLASVLSLSFLSTAAQLETVKSDDGLWEYATIEDYLLIQSSAEESSAYFGNDKDVVIPNSINGILIGAIGENAFLGNKNINSVTIPVSVVYISTNAFAECENLSTMYSYCGSYAKTFAENHGYEYVSLGHTYDKSGICVEGDDALPQIATIKAGNVNGGIKLTVTAASGNYSYEVYRTEDLKNYDLVTNVNTSANFTYQDLDLVSGNTYTYSVLVKNSNGELVGRANILNYTYVAKTFVSVANVSKGVKVSWDKVDGASSYEVYRKKSGESSYNQIGTTTSLSYTDTTASSGVTYVYMARAINGDFKGTYSGVTILYLKAPTVTVNNHIKDGIKVSWTKSTGAKGYEIYRKVDDGSYSLYKTISELSFTDTSVTGGVTYSYYVKAYSSDTLSGYFTGKSIMAPCKGIDVSKYNGDVDFTKVKKAGYNFVAIRCGTSYHQEYNKDTKFDKNYADARAAGLNVGVYFYTYATTVSAAKRDAEWCIEMIKDKSYQYPIALDIEDSCQKNMSKEQLSAIVKTFCDTVKKSGYYVCVYSYLDMINNQMDDEIKSNYDLWVAQWNTSCTYKGEYGLWQNSDKGRIPGIDCDFDTDFSYKDYESIISAGGYNNYAKDALNPKTTVTNMTDGIKITFEAVKGATSYSLYKQTKSGLYFEVASGLTDLVYFDTDVECGVNYSYKIVPNVKGVNYAPVGILRLDTPTVTLANVSTGVKVSWNSIEGATIYNVYRKTSGGSYSLLSVTSNLSFVDKTAKSGTKYTYMVRAVSGTNKSNYKGVSLFALASPTTNVANNSKGAKVSWNSVSGAEGYYIYRRTGSNTYTKIATVTGENTLTYIDTTVTSGTAYDYAVKAFNGSTNSSYIHGSVFFISAPKVTVANNHSSVKITWTKTVGADGYYVYRKNGSGSYSKIATINGNETLSYYDKTAVDGTKYTYTVKAYKDSTISGYSGVTLLRLSAPNYTLANTKSGVKITVSNKINGAKGYIIYRKTGDGKLQKIGTTTSLTYTDKTAKSGTTYTYAVRAYNGDYLGGYKSTSIKCKK